MKTISRKEAEKLTEKVLHENGYKIINESDYNLLDNDMFINNGYSGILLNVKVLSNLNDDELYDTYEFITNQVDRLSMGDVDVEKEFFDYEDKLKNSGINPKSARRKTLIDISKRFWFYIAKNYAFDIFENDYFFNDLDNLQIANKDEVFQHYTKRKEMVSYGDRYDFGSWNEPVEEDRGWVRE